MMMQISAELERRILAHIASGKCQTEEDVIREALDTLERRQIGLRALQQQVSEAEADIQAGRIGPFDVEATQRAVRERLGKQGITD